VDTADIFLGQRVNVWVSAILFLVGLIAFVVLFRRRRPALPRPAAPSSSPVPAAPGHVPTARPEAAIAARQRTQRRKKT